MSWNNITINEYKDICSVVNDSNLILIDKVILLENYFGIRSNEDSFWDECTPKQLIEEINKIKWVFEQPPKTKSSFNIHTINLGQYIDIFESVKKGDDYSFLKLINVPDTIGNLLYYKEQFEIYYKDLKSKNPLIYGSSKETLTEEITLDEINQISNAKDKSAAMKSYKKDVNKKNFSWLSMVYALCDGDLSKYETIMKMSNILCHNWLTYRLSLDKNLF